MFKDTLKQILEDVDDLIADITANPDEVENAPDALYSLGQAYQELEDAKLNI